MKKPLRTSTNFMLSERDHEILTGKSQTEPDQNFTIRELYAKHSNGIYPDISKRPEYEDDPLFENYDHMDDLDFDLTDAVLLKMQIDDRNKQIFENIENKKELKQKLQNKNQAEYKAWKLQKEAIEKEEAKKNPPDITESEA